jgi:hypothetical protein
LFHVVIHFRAEAGDFRRDEGRGPDKADEITQHRKQEQVGAGHPGMGDIATNRDGKTIDPAFMAADG